MNTFGRTLVVSSLALATAVAGVAQATSHEGSQADSSSGQQGQQADPHAKVQRIVEQALDNLQLSPDQRESIDRIRGTIAERQAPVQKARADLMNALAQQLSSGHVDRGALEPKVDAFVKAMTKASPAMRGAIEELHAVLTPAQRSQLVDEIRRGIDKQQQEQASGHKAMLDKLSKDLGLTRSQRRELKSAIHGLRPSFDEARQNLDRVLDAFRADAFSIDHVIPQREVAARAVTLTQAIVDIADAATNVLTADQLARAGDQLRQAASAGGGPAGQAGQTPGRSGSQAGARSGHVGAGQSGAGQSGAGQSGAGQLGAGPIGPDQPGAGQPGMNQPGMNQPGMSQPGGGQYGSGANPGAGQAGRASGSTTGPGTKKGGPMNRATDPCLGEARQSCDARSIEQPLEVDADAIGEDEAALAATPDDVDPGDASADEEGALGESEDALHGWGRFGPRFGGWRGWGGGYRGGYYGFAPPTFDDVFIGGYGYSPYYAAYPGGYSYSYGVPFYGGYGYVW